MADNKKIQSDISGFFDRLRGQDKIRKSDSLIILDTPQSDRERQTKQKISSIVQFVKNKTWSRRHVEFFEEYRRMSSTFPIIKAGLDIYAEETTARDSNGNIFTIKCDNKKVKDLLEELFFKTLALNSKGSKIVRQMCQFGNSYGWLTTRPKDGVTDIVFLPPEAIIRENMYDPSNLENYRFVWYGSGGGAMFEPYEIVHWKNSEDIESEPYGTSILRPIVDTWRRVILIREALVIYRITRAPSKLLFKIGTDGMTGDEAFRFAQEMKKEVQKKPLVNPQTGEIDFKYNPMPIAGYTPIPLLDGRTITIAELAKEYQEGKENYVYSIQDNTHQVVAGKVKWCGKNYTANKLIRVWLDNDSYIDSAPEHPFMLRDGSKKIAGELQPGDSLMPGYLEQKAVDKIKHPERTYTTIYNPATGKYEFVHRLVAKEVPKEDEKHNTRHHKDFNRHNNNPTNLQWMDFDEHKKMHGAIITAYNKSPEGRAKVTRCNIERQSHLPLIEYKRSEKGREESREQVYQMLEKRLALTSNWKKNMTITFDDYVWNTLRLAIIKGTVTGHISATKFINNNLLEHLKTINIRKSLTKGISGNVLRKELKNKGFKSFEEYKTAMKLNHKVSKIEILDNVSEDVYCMTVVGLNNEDDRHNFLCGGHKTTGEVVTANSFIFNSIEESIFMPVYEGSPTDVSVLEGASNLDAVEDYKIIKDDLFAGLKIPKSWLSFEEDLSNKSALGEEDIRFAKTIQKIQADFVEGLLHIGLVHLFMKGCSQEEMQSFTIEMNNPSIASEKKKLELVETRLNIAKSAWDYNNPGLNLMSYVDVLKSILKFTDKEVEQIIKAQFNEKKIAWRLEQLREKGMYKEPEIEKKLAELKGLTGSADGKVASGLDSLQFEGGTLTEMLKSKIDEEIREILSPVSATPSAKQVRTLTEGALTKNLRKAKKDFGL